jgi:hypothetical protein
MAKFVVPDASVQSIDVPGAHLEVVEGKVDTSKVVRAARHRVEKELRAVLARMSAEPVVVEDENEDEGEKDAPEGDK